jgi:hypothetical protein
MKLRLILAGLVIALSACATNGGKNATDAQLIMGAEAAYGLAVTLYKAGKLTNAEGVAVEAALTAVVGFVEASRAAEAAGDKASSAAYLRAAADALDALTATLAKKG